MFATRWNPFSQPWWNQFNQLNRLRDEVEQLFERNGNGQPAANSAMFPPINLWEDGDCLQVEAELPGFRLEDLEIFVTGQNELSIKGERKPQAPAKSVQHRRERFFGSFNRTLTLPVAIDGGKVDARLENGVLRISLAKQEQAKPRKITVKG
jgi:HSP20 family protein